MKPFQRSPRRGTYCGGRLDCSFNVKTVKSWLKVGTSEGRLRTKTKDNEKRRALLRLSSEKRDVEDAVATNGELGEL